MKSGSLHPMEMKLITPNAEITLWSFYSAHLTLCIVRNSANIITLFSGGKFNMSLFYFLISSRSHSTNFCLFKSFVFLKPFLGLCFSTA